MKKHTRTTIPENVSRVIDTTTGEVKMSRPNNDEKDVGAGSGGKIGGGSSNKDRSPGLDRIPSA